MGFGADGPDTALWVTDGTQAGTHEVLDFDPDGDAGGVHGWTLTPEFFYVSAIVRPEGQGMDHLGLWRCQRP